MRSLGSNKHIKRHSASLVIRGQQINHNETPLHTLLDGDDKTMGNQCWRARCTHPGGGEGRMWEDREKEELMA